MKQPKNRLHRVLIVGATPSGILAANKLGELGIPVTLVDPEPDMDEKLSREEWRLPSGVAMNYAHRSGLLRIMRNPLIRCIIPGSVTSLRHTPEGFRARITQGPTFINAEQCILCGRCIEICPVTAPDGARPIRTSGRRALPGRPVIDKGPEPLCQAECPLGVNAQGYIALTRAGRYEEALALVRRDNILPGICGRVCTHPCEKDCRRNELDEPISIRDIKRFLADYEMSHPHDEMFPDARTRPEKIAIVGSGPAGLAAAADLGRLGYRVAVFEKESMAGGLLRYGIGAHRLPRDILDHEIEYIRKLGVEFILSNPVSIPDDLGPLREEFDAVILATGTWLDRKLNVPGEDLKNIEGGLSFLNRFYRGEVHEVDEKVAIIGDGNAAFDLARTIRRMGAAVTILSWFPEDLIPADKEEIRGALEEEIKIVDRTEVIAFKGQNGTLSQLHCRPTRPGPPDSKGIPWPVPVPEGEPFDLAFDRVFVAIGQDGGLKYALSGRETASSGRHFKLSPEGLIQANDHRRSSMSMVYAAGDAVTGPSSVVEAMAAGRTVARSVHEKLAGGKVSAGGTFRPGGRDFPVIPPNIASIARPKMPERQPGSRSDNFDEVCLGLNESQIIAETERCLQCGICSECFQCVEACRAIGAIEHDQGSQDIYEHAGVLIIADEESAPPVRGEDVIRAYGPKSAKADTYDMMTRGMAAAAGAMVLLRGASQRPKGHGISSSPPDPELSPEIRIGVFICRCNDAFGWHQEMDAYAGGLPGIKDIVHAEVMRSACIPEGISHIIRTIRNKAITRIVLASCVCCPMDFICSACTDQRSRLKDGLFKGTGVSRSMAETIDLRGEVLSYLKHDPETALERFRGYIARSIQRARNVKALPAPVRNYNFTTAVVGDSEAVFYSARSLADAGLEVFMFGSLDNPLARKLIHPNVHCFENSEATGISGSLGGFQVYVISNGFFQAVQAGTVILGEKARRRVPYIPQEGQPGQFITPAMQKKGLKGVPFRLPGMTSIAGLFLASPPGLHVSEKKKGAAAAALAAAIMPRGPRQNKGYTVRVDEPRCRGCGRCIRVCPYQAITFRKTEIGGWCAVVDEALCKGCGNCTSVCPSNAADSRYRDFRYLERMIEEVLLQ